MLVARGETYKFEVYRRKQNSAYEWEDAPYCVFYGRPANQMDKKKFRLQKGVNGNTDSVYILSSNLPVDIQLVDKVVFLGKEWKVEGTGYYFDSSLIVNADVLSEDQIIERCPKGVSLQ